MIIPGQFGFNCPSGFREEAFWNIVPIGSNVKLSPVVSAILNFISDQKNNKSTPLKLIDSNIGCLLFADDLLILSETKEGLQHSLNNLSNYCDNWQLAINVNKTKSMIFKQNYTKTEPSFVYYRNNQIQNVSEYPFLGITLKSNGNLSHSTTDLAKKAKKALFCIKSYTTSLKQFTCKSS